MKAGNLKEKIEIYKPVATKTDFGNNRITYELHYTTRCMVRHDSGNKEETNGEIFHSKNKMFIVRYYVPVQENMRIKYDGDFYSINSIVPNKWYHNLEIDTVIVND